MHPRTLTIVNEKVRHSGGVTRLRIVLEREAPYLGFPRVQEYEDILNLVRLRAPRGKTVRMRIHKRGWRETTLVVRASWLDEDA